MVLRRRGDRDRKAEGRPPALSSDVDLDGAIDGFAAVLLQLSRSTARGAGVAAELDAWARHILQLSPAPGGHSTAPTAREWGAARSHAIRHIQEEQRVTGEAVSDLQSAIWGFAENLSRALSADIDGNSRATTTLDRLKAAIDGSPDELKRTAVEAATALGELLEERSARQDSMASELGQQITSLGLELEHARREAELDGLTEIANRRSFDRELERAIQMRTLLRDPVSLILADIDGFKLINDRHGHTGGDEALRAVSREMSRTFPRKSDLVARFGGDEFAVILRYATESDALRMAESLGQRLRECRVTGPSGSPIELTASIGVTTLEMGATVGLVLQQADAALYAAKEGGRDRAVLYSQPEQRAA